MIVLCVGKYGLFYYIGLVGFVCCVVGWWCV